MWWQARCFIHLQALQEESPHLRRSRVSKRSRCAAVRLCVLFACGTSVEFVSRFARLLSQVARSRARPAWSAAAPARITAFKAQKQHAKRLQLGKFAALRAKCAQAAGEAKIATFLVGEVRSHGSGSRIATFKQKTKCIFVFLSGYNFSKELQYRTLRYPKPKV